MTQIAVPTGTSASLSIPAGSRLLIIGAGTYRVGPLGTSARPTVDELIDTSTSIGPFEADCQVRIWSTGSTTYELVAPNDVLDQTGRPVDGNALRALVSGAGSTVAATEFPPERIALSATGSVCPSPSVLTRVRCTAGSQPAAPAPPVALVVYDNPAASTGTQLLSWEASAGQEAAISAPIRAINGMRAVIPAGFAFDFSVSQEA